MPSGRRNQSPRHWLFLGRRGFPFAVSTGAQAIALCAFVSYTFHRNAPYIPSLLPCSESLTDATSCRRQAGSHISRIGDKNPAISSPIGSEIRNDVEAQKCRVCTSGTAENKKGATFGRLYAGRLPSLGGDAPDVRAHLGAGRRQNTTCVTRGPAIIRADIEGVGPHLLVGNTVIADDAS